jgi:hypothetical protein
MDTKQKKMLRKADEERKKAEEEQQRKDKRAATNAAKRKADRVEGAKKKPKDKKSTVPLQKPPLRSATQQHTQPDTAADMEPEADQATVPITRATRSSRTIEDDFAASSEKPKKTPKVPLQKPPLRSATKQQTQPDTAADMEPEADQATVQNTRSTRSGTGLYDFTASQQALPVKKRRAKK